MSKYITTTEETGTTNLPANYNRNYFAVFATTGSLTVKFNNGTGTVPLLEGGFYEPIVAPTSTIEIVGGTYTIAES